ncbi:hypothetical protein D9757_004468 [Collybiopsis confluens]|uniref:Uncharacterized protein n=1 Tax=Collybiopsis confluens TaxID=2823264 RepID=A0A8H5HWH6_9AGAR|nr:hypothetical protein D9757_004468 [Collybiopsis confluens]
MANADADAEVDKIVAGLEEMHVKQKYYPSIAPIHELYDRYSTGYCVAFNDTRVRRVPALPRYAAYTLATTSAGDDLDRPIQLGGSESSILSYATRKDGSAKRRTTATDTPPSRAKPRDRADSRRAWLTGWLLINGMFACHISHMPPCAHLQVEFAHILLPQSERDNNNTLSIYEFILGMDDKTLNIHSRLFLLPLKVNLHSLKDDRIFAILPCLAEMELVNTFLRSVLKYRRAKHGERDRNHKQKAETRGPRPPWDRSRIGTDNTELSKLKDGHIHRYHVLIHPHSIVPQISEDLIKHSTNNFYSHLSPLAAFLDTLKTLRSWDSGDKVPAYEPVEGVTLADALMLSTVDIPDGRQILEEFQGALSLLQSILSYYEVPASTDVFGSQLIGGNSKKRDGDGPSKNLLLRHLGLEGLKLGQWNESSKDGEEQEEGEEKGDNAGVQDDVRNNSPSLDLPDESDLPNEGDLLSIQPCKSLADAWSFDDSDDGEIVDEPNAHNFSLGLSPSQQVVLDWQCRRDSASIVQSSISTSSTLLHTSAASATSSLSVTTSCSSSVAPPSPPKPTPNILASNKFEGYKGGQKLRPIARKGGWQAVATVRQILVNL